LVGYLKLFEDEISIFQVETQVPLVELAVSEIALQRRASNLLKEFLANHGLFTAGVVCPEIGHTDELRDPHPRTFKGCNTVSIS
jgi:hypothetical protein